MAYVYELTPAMRANTVYYSPNAGSYAVIRMNPVAMVKHLNDSEALSAAEALQTKAYLVYLHLEVGLPFSAGEQGYGYVVCPIAPSLRAKDEEKGYAADMCVPIFPNTSHPLGRTPVRTEPVFPYNNCYHWEMFQTDIRVRARPEKFDERQATMLPDAECEKLEEYLRQDIPRMDELRNQYRAATGWQAPPVQLEMLYSEESFDSRQTSASSYIPSVCSFTISNLSEESEDSVDSVMEIFGGPNDPVFPLVDLWLDLAENMKQEDIPDPLAFFKERDAVVSIIQAARERAYAARDALHPGTNSKNDTALTQQHGSEAGEVKTKGSIRSLLRMPKLPPKWSSSFDDLINRVRRLSRTVRATYIRGVVVSASLLRI